MQEAYYWPQQYSPLWSPKLCRLYGLFVEVGLTTLGIQDGGTDSRPIFLTDSDSHDCAGPTVCKGKDPASWLCGLRASVNPFLLKAGSLNGSL